MRALIVLLPALLMAQTPPPKAASTPPKAAPTGAPKAAPKAATTSPATPAATAANGPALTTEDDKTVYALGLSVARNLAQFDLSPNEIAIIKRALTDAANNKPAVDINVYGPKIQALAQGRAARAAEKQKAGAAAFLAKAAAEPGAVKTPSGLVYKQLRPGTGASPTAADTVKVHYRGTLTNGTEFDSSYKRNEPAQFPLNGVVKCWTEGVQKMKVGEKAQLTCPSEIAYGDSGHPPTIPGGATLIFEIELLDIVKK